MRLNILTFPIIILQLQVIHFVFAQGQEVDAWASPLDGEHWIKMSPDSKQQLVLAWKIGYYDGLYHCTPLLSTDAKSTMDDFSKRLIKVSLSQIVSGVDEVYSHFEYQIIPVASVISLCNSLAIGVLTREIFFKYLNDRKERALKGESPY